jgi:hypothetical protein
MVGEGVMSEVIHRARVAWDGARALADCCVAGSTYPWLSARVREVLGPAYDDALWQSRLKLVGPHRRDARYVEIGTWRVRLEDVLQAHPELTLPRR